MGLKFSAFTVRSCVYNTFSLMFPKHACHYLIGLANSDRFHDSVYSIALILPCK